MFVSGQALLNADSDDSSNGKFTCLSTSSIHLSSLSVSVKVFAQQIDLFCNLTGLGDVSISCGAVGCNMQLGNNISANGFHLTNSELHNIQTGGELTLGSNFVSLIYVDGAAFEYSTAQLLIFAGGSNGSLIFQSNPSSFSVNRSFEVKVNENLTISTDVVIAEIMSSPTFLVNYDCSGFGLFSVTSSGSVNAAGDFTISTTSISVLGFVNASKILNVDGESELFIFLL
jgi:hypothetical protein